MMGSRVGRGCVALEEGEMLKQNLVVGTTSVGYCGDSNLNPVSFLQPVQCLYMY